MTAQMSLLHSGWAIRRHSDRSNCRTLVIHGKATEAMAAHKVCNTVKPCIYSEGSDSQSNYAQREESCAYVENGTECNISVLMIKNGNGFMANIQNRNGNELQRAV